MEEQLWQMKQQSRTLQEFRESIQLLWDDEASKTLNRAIFNPHQEDDESMVEGFSLQHNGLNESQSRRVLALQYSNEAQELSEDINALITQIDDDLEISTQYHQQYRSFYAESRGMLPEVDKLIQSAMTIGNGAPPYEP